MRRDSLIRPCFLPRNPELQRVRRSLGMHRMAGERPEQFDDPTQLLSECGSALVASS